MATGFGDRLARGSSKAAFPASSQKTSDQKWAEAFADFDPEAYKANEDAKQAKREKLLDETEAADFQK